MLLWTPGIWELVLIFGIILLLFGGKKLPGLARSIGAGITEFKKGLSGFNSALSEDPVEKEVEQDYSDEEAEPIAKSRKLPAAKKKTTKKKAAAKKKTTKKKVAAKTKKKSARKR